MAEDSLCNSSDLVERILDRYCILKKRKKVRIEKLNKTYKINGIFLPVPAIAKKYRKNRWISSHRI